MQARTLYRTLFTAVLLAALTNTLAAPPAPTAAVAPLARGAAGPDAPTITITDPGGPRTIGEGGDFASEAWLDPWDMQQPNDIYLTANPICGNPWPQYSNVQVANGIWSGKVSNVSQSPALLYLVNPSWAVGNVAIGKEGRFIPIDTSRYFYLTFRMKIDYNSSGTNPPVARLRWTNGSFENQSDPSHWAWSKAFHVYTDNQWHLYSLDLRVLPPDPSSTLHWTGRMTGLAIDPGMNPGPTVSLDWVRLSGADVLRTIAWTGGWQSGATVQFSLNGDPVHVYTPGTPLNTWYEPNTVQAAAGQVQVPLSLPPGTYSLTATVTDGTGTGSSGAAGPWTVDPAPLPTITAPAVTSGLDWATQQAGDPWDMDDGGHDVTSVAGLSSYWYSGGVFHGQLASGLQNCVNTGDAQLQLRMFQGTIDPQRYHWLTFRMYMEGTPDMGNGWVARVSWWESNFNTTRCGMSNDILLLSGWNTYSIDLSRSDILEPGQVCHTLWTQMVNGVQHLRLDPTEVPTAGALFHVDYVTLTDGPRASTSYDITWTQAGMAGQQGTVRLYYDTDRDPTNGKTLIAAGEGPAGAPPKAPVWPASIIPRVWLPLAAGGLPRGSAFCNGTACTYHWITSGVPNGAYYIYVEATDSLSTVGHYSDAPVIVAH